MNADTILTTQQEFSRKKKKKKGERIAQYTLACLMDKLMRYRNDSGFGFPNYFALIYRNKK